MLLGSSPHLSEILIELFEDHPQQSVKTIAAELLRRGYRYTSRAVYKELNKLQEQGIVVKARDQFSLCLPWVIELMRFADVLYQSYLTSSAMTNLLPADGRKFIWRFRDLRRMDDFWLHLMFVLFQHSRSKRMFEWIPHYWFHLLHYEKELQAQRAMKVAQNKLYMVLGADTYLDRSPVKYWDKGVYEWSFARSPFHSDRSRYFCVIDDFILVVRLDRRTNARIDQLFSKVKSKADIEAAEVYEVFQAPARIKVSLEQNQRKAHSLKRKFSIYFGVAL